MCILNPFRLNYRREEKLSILVEGILVTSKKPRSDLDLFVLEGRGEEENERD